MKALLTRFHREDRAQVLAIFGLLTFVIIGLMGLASDIGRIYVARAELGRSVDAAALAGAKQLPDIAAADSKARAYITENEPNALVTVEVYPDVPSQQVEVRATKTVSTVFLKALGVGTVDVKNAATAGFGIVPVDAVMALDATGSMGASPCNGSQDNSGCPIYEAKQAAIGFTNTLLPGSNTVVGNTAFRGCFKPTPGTDTDCVDNNTIGYLTETPSTLITKINSVSAKGGTGTNFCGGLDKAAEILYGSGSHSASNTIRNIIILSDGDNTYNNASYVSGASPVTACRPATATCPVSPTSQCNPANSDSYLGTACSGIGNASAGSVSQPHERWLDIATKNRADQLKALGVQIYVVGFGVCGSEDSQVASTSYCSTIGSSSPDTVSDQKLAKCVASSTSGTNDHFFRASTASELPGIFSEIAQQIAFRLIK